VALSELVVALSELVVAVSDNTVVWFIGYFATMAPSAASALAFTPKRLMMPSAMRSMENAALLQAHTTTSLCVAIWCVKLGVDVAYTTVVAHVAWTAAATRTRTRTEVGLGLGIGLKSASDSDSDSD